MSVHDTIEPLTNTIVLNTRQEVMAWYEVYFSYSERRTDSYCIVWASNSLYVGQKDSFVT